MPSVTREDKIVAPTQTEVDARLSARCSAKPLMAGHESSTVLSGNERMVKVGRIKRLKLLAVVVLPCGVSMVIEPVMAFSGTVAVSCRSLNAGLILGVKTAGTPLKSTRVAPVKFVPVKMIVWPG